MRVGSDTGGTFTDLVTGDGRTLKVLSTPDDPGRAVRAGVDDLAGPVGPDDPGAVDVLAHGTTVATNALLERRGARVGLVTTEGFADVVEIGRQDRPSLYDSRVDRPEPLVSREHRFEVRERVDASGAELAPVDPGSLDRAVASGVDALAVCLLHADISSDHERQVGSLLEGAGFDISLSSVVSPEVREYERTATTVVNAYLRPVCRDYLHGLGGVAGRVLVMTSAGGLTRADAAAESPASLLLSGPAGGVLAGAAAAVANGFPDAVTFDMGGTSTDVCLVLGGKPAPAAEREVAGLPVRLPSLDVHTVGAGGGSIARIDAGGALVVGPRSAGAVPGPACYGRGGTEPTVTDADLVAGRLPGDVELAGLGRLDAAAAAEAIEQAGVTAGGVIAVVEANMAQAVRAVTVEQGFDPRDLALVAFGGAGPLHACALADELDMPCVIVPARAGVLSAVGILCAPQQVDLVRSWPTPLDHSGVGDALGDLAEEARSQLLTQLGRSSPEDDDQGDPGLESSESGGQLRPDSDGSADQAIMSSPLSKTVMSMALECRYAGQSHELRVTSVDDFHATHERRNGYRSDDHPVEVIALRATASVASPIAVDQLPVPEHRQGSNGSEPLVGPLALAEPDCAIWIPEGWEASPGAAGALVLTRTTDPLAEVDLETGER